LVIEAQVLKPGMIAQAACRSLPWTIIPMVITNVANERGRQLRRPPIETSVRYAQACSKAALILFEHSKQ
jgi:hypothetical protein